MRLLTAAIILVLAIRAIAASNSSNVTDPINNFCQRLWHQSVVKNDILYIDGGLEVFIGDNNGGFANGTEFIGYNEYLITVALNESWDWKTNISMQAINLTANPDTGSYPPNNILGALYAGASDDPNMYLYGGTASFENMSSPGFTWPTSMTYTLWSYGTLDNTWEQYDISQEVAYRPAGGAWAEATDRGLGFYLNGYIDRGSSDAYAYDESFLKFLDGLVVINTTTQEPKNLSTSPLANYPRARGGLSYISNLGLEGILVSMGGIMRNEAASTADHDNSTYVSFNTVEFLDIESIKSGDSDGTWYTQTTWGDIPDPRTDFCVVAVSAPDNSSHNIYLYGGLGRDTDTAFDQIYVLSLPSFRWIRIYTGDSPRYGHTCHLVARSEMITVGGAKHNNLTDGCDWEVKSVAILDLSTLKWGSVYDAKPSDYTVPSKIYDVIGGSATGNATLTKPANGFSNEQVSAFFTYPRITDTAKASSHGNHLDGGQIAGTVIGSVAGAAISAAVAMLLVIHRKRKQQEQRNTQASDAMSDTHSGIYGKFSKAIFRNRGRPSELDPGFERRRLEHPVVMHEMDADADGVVRHEMCGDARHEMYGGTIPAELPTRLSSDKDCK